jgi:hypothetical protein
MLSIEATITNFRLWFDPTTLFSVVGFGDETILLTSVMCSVEMEHNPVQPKFRNKFSYYPLLMVKGLVAITDGLINWLQVNLLLSY